MTKVKDGETYDLALQHGTWTAENIRALRAANVFGADNITAGDPYIERVTGRVRVFKQDGETRYEVVTREATDKPCDQCGGTGVLHVGAEAVGFLPEHVLEATQ